MAYATVQELSGDEGLGYTPSNAQALLDRASRDIDRALLCSVYEADDEDVVAALKEACLEQVAYQLEQGNTSGIAHGMLPGVPQGASAGSVDLSRGQSVGGSTNTLPLIGGQAWAILQSAGLTGRGPRPV